MKPPNQSKPVPTPKDSSETIHATLLSLAEQIEAEPMPRMARNEFIWRGADVRITDDPNFVRTPRHWLDHDLVVCTPHAEPLSWLFYRLRDAFRSYLDFNNKFGFYGALGERALRHVESNQHDEDYRPLLREVLAEGFGCWAMINENGCIAPNSSIVFHFRDDTGQYHRFEL